MAALGQGDAAAGEVVQERGGGPEPVPRALVPVVPDRPVSGGLTCLTAAAAGGLQEANTGRVSSNMINWFFNRLITYLLNG